MTAYRYRISHRLLPFAVMHDQCCMPMNHATSFRHPYSTMQIAYLLNQGAMPL